MIKPRISPFFVSELQPQLRPMLESVQWVGGDECQILLTQLNPPSSSGAVAKPLATIGSVLCDEIRPVSEMDLRKGEDLEFASYY